MDFTNEEKERINQLYGNDFKDITPADALLIGRWESWKALNEDEHRAKIDAIREQSEASLKLMKEKAAQSRENLEEQVRMAYEYHERMMAYGEKPPQA